MMPGPAQNDAPAGVQQGLTQEAGISVSPQELDKLARSVVDAHRKGKELRRLRDLTAEKYLIHIDGEGNGQYYDIIGGSRVAMVPNLDGGPRAQSNLLRPIVDDFVSYNTSIPYQVIAEPSADRASRDRAKIDTVWANNLIQTQRLNELVAEALYIASAYGHCPIHAQWRQDSPLDLWDGGPSAQIVPGRIDLQVGDPWGTVYAPNATRRSLPWASYERVYPIEVVLDAFPQVAGIEKLRGRKDLPSSSRFQRIARRWAQNSGNTFGTAAINQGATQDESVALIFRELAPGLSREWPRGRLTIIALSGVAEPENGMWGEPMFLHTGPLPGGRFSFSRFYSIDRYDDVLGKAFVSDLDDLQVRRNQLESRLVIGAHRASAPPLGTGPNSIDDDTAAWEDDAILESLNGVMPQFLRYPTDWMDRVQRQIEHIESQMFRIGGWQSASRGESNANDPAAKVVALQRADDSGKGPSNRGVQGSVVELLQIAHALTKEYAGPVPIQIKAAGSDFGYLSSEYIYSHQLSDEPPNFRVTSGFASTLEARAQQLLGLAGMRGADGMPILTTKQLRKSYPDPSIFPHETDLEEVQTRRIQAINEAIRDKVRQAKQQYPELPPEWIEPLAQQISQQCMSEYPPLRDDPWQRHVDGLSEITQDPASDPLEVRVAALRQEFCYNQLMVMQQQAMAAQAGPGAMSDDGRGAGPTGAVNAVNAMKQSHSLGSEVASLTRAAGA
jgi:hypothetical protein